MTHILLLEDDHIQADNITDTIKKRFDVEVTRIATEKAFIEFIDRLGEECPDLAILDVMVRWADPEPDMQLPPPHVKNEGSHRAGLRCLRLLKESGRDVPSIIYTILEKQDLEGEHTLHDARSSQATGSQDELIVLRKEGDRKTLINAIGRILNG
jgi:CheY-like chemotaxis protein